MSQPVNLEVELKEGESSERLIKRFIKKFRNSDLMALFKKHEYYEKPSVKRKRKREERYYKAHRAQQEKEVKET